MLFLPLTERLMYINEIEVENFRALRKTKIAFCHAQTDFEALGMPRPALPNINLLLADNGFGKTTLLKAIALAALGPAVGRSGIYPYQLIRREMNQNRLDPARLGATFVTHEQDHCDFSQIDSRVRVEPKGDLEFLEWDHEEEKRWHPVFSSDSDALFMVGYGSTRRVSKSNRFEQSSRSSARAARVMGLFEEDYSLRPLNSWLPRYGESKQLRGRYVQVERLINRLMGQGSWQFTGLQDSDGEYLFARGSTEVPFPALSDGFRAFLGWVGDLLFHVCETCPSGKKLVENRGIVMVDEIDLHLHPSWQMTVLHDLAQALPNIQFIVTSHSPLIVGTLEWMNIILLREEAGQASEATRIPWAVHGLDADQVLLSDFFGLQSTRAPGRKKDLKALALRARDGDAGAALRLLEEMSRGAEVSR